MAFSKKSNIYIKFYSTFQVIQFWINNLLCLPEFLYNIYYWCFGVRQKVFCGASFFLYKSYFFGLHNSFTSRYILIM